jgi:ADP-ribose pyrophosphatase YjhB (NUDIX family)
MTVNGKITNLVSSGGVVYRRGQAGSLEVALCGRLQSRTWSLPKGTPEEGETIQQTALREVQEETGLEVSIEA